jgi:hypothetical protein
LIVGAEGLTVERFAAVGVLFAVEVFVGLETGVVGVAELSGLLVGDGITGLGTSATGRVFI